MKIVYSTVKKNEPNSFYIPNGMRPGTQIILKGRVLPDTTHFYINLQTEEQPFDGNIVFHFNPRPPRKVVVRNAMQGGWGPEERDTPFFPFDNGRFFVLRIDAEPEGFRTYVNGRPYIFFANRLDMTTARYLCLKEGAEYYDVSIQERYMLPYVTEIPGKMSLGKAMRVRGASLDNSGFSVNFAEDSDNDKIAFHFNPRPNEGVVVRNAKLPGWGPEERDYEAEFPFSPFEYFDALFVAGSDRFLIYVNDHYFAEFKYRSNLEDVSYLILKGSMDIMDVEYVEPMADDFVKTFESGLQKGDVNFFRGFMKPDGERFSINFMTGYSPESDIALHFNPRIGQRQIVMNSRFGGWGQEERVELPKVFEKREPFEVKIVTKRNKFKIFVNGKLVWVYAARGNVEDIKGVNVRGDVYVYQAKLQRRLEKPAWERIPRGLRNVSWILVTGIPKKNADRFAVNFRCGDDDDSDIAFHFNPRFTEGCTVRNTKSGGSWGGEERDQPCFPFTPKDAFDIAINIKEDKFVTYVNGHHYIDYCYRLPVDRVCYLELTGRADFFEPEFL